MKSHRGHRSISKYMERRVLSSVHFFGNGSLLMVGQDVYSGYFGMVLSWMTGRYVLRFRLSREPVDAFFSWCDLEVDKVLTADAS